MYSIGSLSAPTAAARRGTIVASRSKTVRAALPPQASFRQQAGAVLLSSVVLFGGANQALATGDVVLGAKIFNQSCGASSSVCNWCTRVQLSLRLDPLLLCSPRRLLTIWWCSGVPRRRKQRGGRFKDAAQGGYQPVSGDARRERPFRGRDYLPGKASLQLKASRTVHEHDASSHTRR
jgi:hypothetical protein